MFKYLFFSLVFTTQASFLFAQEGVKFGKVDSEELKMVRYDKDTSAGAVILSDIGNSYFIFINNDFELLFERRVRIKILKKSGYDWANGEIPVYVGSNSKEEEVTKLKGYTYNLIDGKVIRDKLNDDAIFKEQKSEKWFVKKFTMPNVKEGSIIEYSYTIHSDFWFNLQPWAFQYTIPVRYSEYRVTIPEYFHYKPFMQGYENIYATSKDVRFQFTIKYEAQNNGSGTGFSRTPGGLETIDAKATEQKWTAKDVPAFRTEKYITIPEDFITKVEFELGLVKFPNSMPSYQSTSWEKIAEDLLKSESFGLQLNRAGFLKDQVAIINSKYKTPVEKTIAAFIHVKNTMKWNGQKRLEVSSSTKKSYENKTGNSADINLMLIAFLRELGVEANPVVLSTRDHGRIIPVFPIISKFNYVIAHVVIDDKYILLDATEQLSSWQLLPERCLNGEGRLISEKKGGWISLKPLIKSQQYFSGKLKISNEGAVQGDVYIAYNGYHALNKRKEILSEGKSKHIENLKKELHNWEFDEVIIHNFDSLNKELKYEFKDLTINESGMANVIYLDPMMGQGEKENPFKAEERKYPVDFAIPIDNTFTCSITLPDGYKIDEKPKSSIVELPEKSGRFTFTITELGNTLNIVSRISISKNIFTAEEYHALKEFFGLIVNKHAEKIVLKKI